MKIIITLAGIFLPLFFPFNCDNEINIDCSAYNYSPEDFAGKYRADNITTSESCFSDITHQSITSNDSLDYILELYKDGTGKISGPDTLVNFKWVEENITSRVGKSSAGCYNEFRVWTKDQKIDFQLFQIDKNGLELYRQDSSWNFSDCTRESTYYFARIK